MKTKFRSHGQKLKTNGQKLYDYTTKKYPCPTCGKAPHRVGWDFLSQTGKDLWEKNAVGHHMFTS